MSDMHKALDAARQADLAADPSEHSCACFPGSCRGGDVVNGKLACGRRCRQAAPAAGAEPTMVADYGIYPPQAPDLERSHSVGSAWRTGWVAGYKAATAPAAAHPVVDHACSATPVADHEAPNVSGKAAQPVAAFADADPEALYIEQGAHLNCPACGGSGHVEDTTALQTDLYELLFALIDVWPYVERWCTISPLKARVLTLIQKHGESRSLDQPHFFRQAAQALAAEARRAGLVLTIEQSPSLPLAMGNHADAVSVRPARGTAA